MWLQRCLHFLRGDITVTSAGATQVAFKNCAKIYGITIDDAEDLDLVMLMYSLIEYNYKTGKI